MPYQIVDNPQLQVIKKRYEKLPHPSSAYNGPRGLHLLGTHHTTQHFSVRGDGSAEITFDNESLNDTFSVTIHLALVSFQIELKKNHELYYQFKNEVGNTVREHHLQSFAITVGDLFKLFYKQNTSFFDRKQHAKKSSRGRHSEEGEDEETEKKRAQEEEEEEDRERVAKLTMKALKVNTSLIPDPRDILGSLVTWKESRLKLWTLLTREGHIKKPRSDFTSFCSTLIVLPMFWYNQREMFDTEFPKIATYEFMKKVTRYYLFAEDPEVKVYPERDFFAEPKSIVDVCELYADQINVSTLVPLKRALTRTLNQGEQSMLEFKYPQDLVFDNIGSVEETYPAYALRKIQLESWCTVEDCDALRRFVDNALQIAMSDKAKKTIKKRGKFQKYSTYEDYSSGKWREYKVKERHNFNKLIQEDFVIKKKSF